MLDAHGRHIGGQPQRLDLVQACRDGERKCPVEGIACAQPGFFPMPVKSRRERFKIPADKMAVDPYMGSDTNSHAYKAGLRGCQVITAVNGESPNLVAREFLAWFMHKFDPGDQVRLSVLDANGEPREVTYQLPPLLANP